MTNPLAASEANAPLPYELQVTGYVALVVLTVRPGDSVTYGEPREVCTDTSAVLHLGLDIVYP